MSEQNSSQEKTEEASAETQEESRRWRSPAPRMSPPPFRCSPLLLLKLSAELLDGMQQSFSYSYINFQQSEIGIDDLQVILTHNLLVISVLLPLLLTPILGMPGWFSLPRRTSRRSSASSTPSPAWAGWSARRTGASWPSRC